MRRASLAWPFRVLNPVVSSAIGGRLNAYIIEPVTEGIARDKARIDLEER